MIVLVLVVGVGEGCGEVVLGLVDVFLFLVCVEFVFFGVEWFVVYFYVDWVGCCLFEDEGVVGLYFGFYFDVGMWW